MKRYLRIYVNGKRYRTFGGSKEMINAELERYCISYDTKLRNDTFNKLTKSEIRSFKKFMSEEVPYACIELELVKQRGKHKKIERYFRSPLQYYMIDEVDKTSTIAVSTLNDLKFHIKIDSINIDTLILDFSAIMFGNFPVGVMEVNSIGNNYRHGILTKRVINIALSSLKHQYELTKNEDALCNQYLMESLLKEDFLFYQYQF